MSAKDKPAEKRPPKLNLPFRGRPEDPGEWAFDHRVGLLVTVIAYLVAGIIFMSARIAIGEKQEATAFYIDLVDEQPKPVIPQDRQLLSSEQLRDVRNRTSNQNAEQQSLNSRLRDDRGTQAQQIYDEAEAAQQRSAANRRAYEEGLRQAQQQANGKTPAGGEKPNDVKVQGRVTVSFSLINPIRNSANLVVPAYQCEGGGELIIDITVNRNGDVISASVARVSASVDDCMTKTALAAAYKSRFNVNGSAPDKQHGTITYIFIPQ